VSQRAGAILGEQRCSGRRWALNPARRIPPAFRRTIGCSLAAGEGARTIAVSLWAHAWLRRSVADARGPPQATFGSV